MIKIDAKDLEYINNLAEALKVEPYVLLAIIEVESNGVIGNPDPIIRWEGHYFDRLVPAKLRDIARKQGLSSPTAGKIKNPAGQLGRYAILNKAVLIDKEAAYSSISIGVGQVMGANWKDLGFKSAEDMFRRGSQGFQGQVDLMIAFIKFNGLLDELQRKDWSAFARAYNGPNYRAGGYHTKMEAAYNRMISLTGIEVTTPSANGMLRMGSQGAKVREVQQLLVRAGFVVKVDGDFGPTTKDAVKDFQKKYKLTVDGVIGPDTQAELLTWKTAADEKVGQVKATELPGFKTGTNIALGGGLIFMLQQFTHGWADKQVLLIGLAVIIGGALFAIDAYQKSKLTYEGVTK